MKGSRDKKRDLDDERINQKKQHLLQLCRLMNWFPVPVSEQSPELPLQAIGYSHSDSIIEDIYAMAKNLIGFVQIDEQAISLGKHRGAITVPQEPCHSRVLRKNGVDRNVGAIVLFWLRRVNARHAINPKD